MSTAYTSAKKQFIGNGSATEFGFDFPYKAESEIKVYLKRGDANEVVLTQGTDYSFVSENTIKFPTSGSSQTILTSSDVLAIQRESEFESLYDFSNQQRLEPEEVMHSDDNLERQVQELKRDVDSSVKVTPTSLISPTGLTEHIERVYASTDNIDIVAGSIASVNTNAANVEDINTVAGSIGNVNTVADNIGNVNKVAAIDTKVSAVAANVEDINTVAGSIGNVNTVADISASVSVVAGISEDVEQVAMIKDQTAAVSENISDVMTVADINTQVSTVAANVDGVKDVGDNINAVLQAPTHAENARKWAEGTDSEVTPLGGTHSAKGWAEQAAAIVRLDDASETVKGLIRIATADEAEAGAMDTVAMTPLKTKYVADDYTGKGLQLGFNGTLEGSVLTFNPDESSYVLKQGYDYEIDLLFPAVGVLPDDTQIVIKNDSDTIQVVNVRHADASTPITYGDMKQICRYDTNIGWRWVFNARYAVTDTGVAVFVMPSYAFQDSRYVTTDTAQNINAGKNFINNTSSTNIDAHTNMSICLKNEQAELGADTLNADGSVNFKYQGIRTVDKNNEEVSYLYSAPDGVGGSFTRLGASTKVNGEYADAFIDIEVDANGKGHLYIPDVDTDSTVSGNQAATKEYVDGRDNAVTNALTSKINSALPTGTIIIWSASTAPNGYLFCDGSAISRTTYARLFKVIGTTWGAGDGNTTFNVPNFNDKTIYQAPSLSVGKIVAGSLPNITASWTAQGTSQDSRRPVLFNGNGAIETGTYKSGGGFACTLTNIWDGQTAQNFKASRSSSLYRDGETQVVPASGVIRFYIRY